MTGNTRAQTRALLAALGVIVVWGSAFTIQKAAYDAMTPSGFLFARYGLMAACAAVLLRVTRKPLWPALRPGEWRTLLRVTATGQVGHVVLVTYGIHWSTAFSSALIYALGPLCTLLLLWMFGKGRLHREQVVGVGLACLGVFVFMSEKFAHETLTTGAGDLLILVAVVLFSAYTVTSTPLVQRYGGVAVMCWTTLLSAVVVVPPLAWLTWNLPWTHVSAAIWAAVCWSVLMSAFGGWLVWAWVNAVRGVDRTAPLLYLVPPVAGVVAWLVRGESFGMMKIVGAACVLSGVALAQWNAARRAKLPV